MRNGTGDAGQAPGLPRRHRARPDDGPNTDGLGIIAASKNGLSDCDGSQYYASLHTGATSWYLLALQSANPFFLLN